MAAAAAPAPPAGAESADMSFDPYDDLEGSDAMSAMSEVQSASGASAAGSSHSAIVTDGNETRLCCICGRCTCKKRRNHCVSCEPDIKAARRDAQRSGGSNLASFQ